MKLSPLPGFSPLEDWHLIPVRHGVRNLDHPSLTSIEFDSWVDQCRGNVVPVRIPHPHKDFDPRYCLVDGLAFELVDDLVLYQLRWPLEENINNSGVEISYRSRDGISATFMQTR